MGKEWVSKKDPRWICERTISNSTMNFATLKRPNPEYIGLTLEQAKAREKLKEMEGKTYKTQAARTRAKNRKKELLKIAGLEEKKYDPKSEKEDSIAMIVALIFFACIMILFFVIWNKIKDWWNNTPSTIEQRSIEKIKIQERKVSFEDKNIYINL